MATNDIQGLPEGAVLKPIASASQPAVDASQIEGLPAGATLKPIAADTAAPPAAPPLSRSAEANQVAFHTPFVPEPIAPPQDHKEELVKNIAGDRGLTSYRAAREAVMHVENLIKAPAGAYDAAKQYVQGIPDTIKKAVMPEPWDLDPTHHEFRAAPITPIPGVGAAAEAFGAEEAAATKAAPMSTTLLKNPFRKPSLVQQIVQGEKVAQAPAQAAVRGAAKAGAAEAGLSTVPAESTRTLLEEPINTVNAAKKNIYGQVDKAAGTDLKTLYDKLDAINDKIDLEASGSPEESRLEAQRTSQMQTIEDAKDAARKQGVDVDKMLSQGDALHTREMALRDVQKAVFKNTNIVEGNTAAGTPETVNVNSAVKAAQRLQDNTKFGAPRLEQAFGKQGAKNLLDNLYAAQRMGVKAASRQKLAEWIAGATAATATGADIIKHLTD